MLSFIGHLYSSRYIIFITVISSAKTYTALTTCTPDMLSGAWTNILIHLIISTTLQVGAIITLFHRFKKQTTKARNHLAPEQGSSTGWTQHRQSGSSSPGSKPLRVRSTKISTSSPLFTFLPLLCLVAFTKHSITVAEWTQFMPGTEDTDKEKQTSMSQHREKKKN